MADDDNTPVSAKEAFISGLPAHLQTQLRNGIPDLTNVPMESLRRMAVEGALDGAIGDLEGAAMRGGNHPLDWRGNTDISMEKGDIAVPPSSPSPPLPHNVRKTGKGGPDLS